MFNLAGGIKAWNQEVARGDEERGLALFSGSALPADFLAVAYSLEQGLRDFYLTMIPRVAQDEAKKLFRMLADIEMQHQNTVLALYREEAGREISREEFEQGLLLKAMEGGLSTEEYTRLYASDLNSLHDLIAIAISIEAQALDLYLRAADRLETQGGTVLRKIAAEEQSHLRQLGRLLDQTAS